MDTIWDFLTAADNRGVLSLIGGGVAAVAAGFWAVFTYFHGRSSRHSTNIEDHSIGAGRDFIYRSNVTHRDSNKEAKDGP
jgi:hypothetical protein